ncbi:hypothetical protein INF37_04425 [Pseudoflavonifractor sp. DSM 107456]|uniref:DUF6291 domain-containing protein n=1 Tax=Pseudoflavonifractor gallinarum TaxID=2779352 RepID=A0ABR9R972_9FIRM|nr:DUF6291 domain-containing protein [Pseudoflavonifractor gallinarum]MBE5055245.1 hypothetical protein [Pseudoflavonifractor gallinarum]
MAQKKSFLVYFDNYPMVQALPLEQRGLLLTALFEYGMAAGEPDSPSIPEILEAFPAMTEETRMACLFMCSNIHRDTQRWLGRQAAQERRRTGQGSGPETGERTYQARDVLAQIRQDLAHRWEVE